MLRTHSFEGPWTRRLSVGRAPNLAASRACSGPLQCHFLTGYTPAGSRDTLGPAAPVQSLRRTLRLSGRRFIVAKPRPPSAPVCGMVVCMGAALRPARALALNLFMAKVFACSAKVAMRVFGVGTTKPATSSVPSRLPCITNSSGKGCVRTSSGRFDQKRSRYLGSPYTPIRQFKHAGVQGLGFRFQGLGFKGFGASGLRGFGASGLRGFGASGLRGGALA